MRMAGAAALVFAVSSPASAEQLVLTNEDEAVIVRTRSGDVEVRTSTTARLVVRSKGRGELRVTHRAGRVRIKSRGGDGVWVEMPAGLRLEVRTRSGRVDVRVPTAKLELESRSGDFSIYEPSRDVDVETISGDIEIEGDIERLRLSAISGDVRIESFVEEARLRTTSGDVRIRSRKLPIRLEMQTLSGDANLLGALPRDAAYRFRSTSGDLKIERTNGQGLFVQSRTVSGDLKLPRRRDEDECEECCSRCPVQQVVDGGGANLRFESFSGDLVVRESPATTEER